MTLIKNFIAEISQMKTLWKYIHAKSIEKRFKELCKDFDNCINVLTLTITVNSSDELEQLKVDLEDLNKVSLNNFNLVHDVLKIILTYFFNYSI